MSGQLERGSNTTIVGRVTPITIKAGTWGIANGTQAWGQRLDASGNPPAKDKVIRVEDDAYRGLIRWLRWGDPRGTLINARYLSGHPTLDKSYQETRLGVKVVDGFVDGESISLITMPHGFNEFDEEERPAFVQMLKIHHQNPKSIYCNPESEAIPMYFEVDDSDNNDEKSTLIETKGELLMLVGSASSKPENIRTLFEIVKDQNRTSVNLEDASEVYKYLQVFADQDPKSFSNRVNGYKERVSAVLEKGRSYNIFDTTKDGFIAAGVTKKEIIIDEVPAKGDAMIDWVMEHCLEPKAYDSIVKIQTITDTLK